MIKAIDTFITPLIDTMFKKEILILHCIIHVRNNNYSEMKF